MIMQHQLVSCFAKEKIRFFSDCQHDTLFKGFIFLLSSVALPVYIFNFPLSVSLFICRDVWQVR